MSQVTQPDASGGLGSFAAGLLSEITGGIKLVAAGELAKRYGFSFGADGQVLVDADGAIRSNTTPAKTTSVLSSPLVVAVGIAALVGVLVLAIRR